MGVAALGCGGGSGSKYTGVAGILASCGVPACYLDLVLACMPDGACVRQTTTMCGASVCPTPSTTTPTAVMSNMCFDNGVKILMEMDTSNPLATTATDTVKKGSAVCFTTVSGPVSSDSRAVPVTVKNAAGTTVATVVVDMTARTETITCVGGSSVVVSMDCGSSGGGTPNDAGSSCPPGICEL
jgi:hypothetical protein